MQQRWSNNKNLIELAIVGVLRGVIIRGIMTN
jgi:hypothetical protein